ncbi:MAG: hypothetical protein GY772_00690 [bacterium]|nr:hypothetical protein [bacterium]
MHKKLDNLFMKVAGKLRISKDSGAAAAYYVSLKNPHRLLREGEGTMVLGADVTHNACGVSIAGVVATQGSDFATYYSELRAQEPCRDSKAVGRRLRRHAGYRPSDSPRWTLARQRRLFTSHTGSAQGSSC